MLINQSIDVLIDWLMLLNDWLSLRPYSVQCTTHIGPGEEMTCLQVINFPVAVATTSTYFTNRNTQKKRWDTTTVLIRGQIRGAYFSVWLPPPTWGRGGGGGQKYDQITCWEKKLLKGDEKTRENAYFFLNW